MELMGLALLMCVRRDINWPRYCVCVDGGGFGAHIPYPLCGHVLKLLNFTWNCQAENGFLRDEVLRKAFLGGAGVLCVCVCVCVCETLLWDGSGCVCSFLTFNKLLLGIVAAANVIIQFGGSLIHLALLWNKSFISFICFFCCLNYSLYKGNSTTFIGLALLSHNFKGDHYC